MRPSHRPDLSADEQIERRLLLLRSDPFSLAGLAIAARARQRELDLMLGRIDLLPPPRDERDFAARCARWKIEDRMSDLSSFHGAELHLRGLLIKLLAARAPRVAAA